VVTTETYDTPQQVVAPNDLSVTAITKSLSTTHLFPTQTDPSTVSAYASSFDHVSQTVSSPDNHSQASPPTSPSTSASRDGCSSGSDGDADYVTPSDDDGEYHPTRSAPRRKERKRKTTSGSKRPRRTVFSPTRSSSSDSSATSPRSERRPHPYRREVLPRNIQCEKDTSFDPEVWGFRCPVDGCDWVQENQRIPDLKRHIVTHGRCKEPRKWVCCGVGIDRAHLYGKGVEEDMTEEEFLLVGGYWIRGRLMIGGCMQAFSRRDALKRHVDNPKLPCIGHMGSYY
jgi:hypothetical protein